ncbi:MAG: gamma-glutamyl-gamma-aminobutyrate hydrolase family protein [Vicinamibacterales bacterium]
MSVIAVSPCRTMADYLESVRRVGGEPEELAVGDPIADVVRRAAGVLLTGGGDVDPALYGEARHPTFAAAEPGRDRFEMDLARAAFAADRPILAICRGMQVLNVALGGTLIQDVPTMVDGALPHSVPEPRFAIAHEVWVTKNSVLWTLMRDKLEGGDTCQVNSRHHQAVKNVATGWEVTATAPDGVVEAMEFAGRRFCLAVQWHPENFWRTGEFRPLFEGLVEVAGKKS